MVEIPRKIQQKIDLTQLLTNVGRFALWIAIQNVAFDKLTIAF